MGVVTHPIAIGFKFEPQLVPIISGKAQRHGVTQSNLCELFVSWCLSGLY